MQQYNFWNSIIASYKKVDKKLRSLDLSNDMDYLSKMKQAYIL